MNAWLPSFFFLFVVLPLSMNVDRWISSFEAEDRMVRCPFFLSEPALNFIQYIFSYYHHRLRPESILWLDDIRCSWSKFMVDSSYSLVFSTASPIERSQICLTNKVIKKNFIINRTINGLGVYKGLVMSFINRLVVTNRAYVASVKSMSVCVSLVVAAF